ncbi:hypothetical protein HYH03_013123 [Edaphochlamys debaryana]|uniref:FAS1 domain-containing protein n=1 Tax=Edaphochlamys debaryana TaxID=47281 RepID=A0A835XRH2_9CHLO|nr:hypothetical protein HYH03_013123 [Edaphochlamys debaryana]|eukprot:KAG2488272.1 hypothetical protein HYH03_013123 [Edaphochlamys debaryana]
MPDGPPPPPSTSPTHPPSYPPAVDDRPSPSPPPSYPVIPSAPSPYLPTPQPPAAPTILALLAARPDTTLLQALLSALPELEAVGSDPHIVLTFFAPSDVAFQRVASDLGVDLTSAWDSELLMELLAYHFVPDALLTTEALPEGTSQYNTSLVGYSITIEMVSSLVRVVAAASAADVVVSDLRAGQVRPAERQLGCCAV